MIGIYNYTVIITYLSAVSAGIGMYFSIHGQIKTAIFFLMFSGLCDMLDGPIARTMKNRSETAKKFGIQIDSLCDCVSFGVQPAVLLYGIASNCEGKSFGLEIFALASGIILVLCAIIRLAFFNVSEEERQNTEGSKPRTGYRGMPVTNVTLLFPLVFLSSYFIEGVCFSIVMTCAGLVTAALFIIDFSFPKLHGKKLIPVGVIGLLMFIAICFA